MASRQHLKAGWSPKLSLTTPITRSRLSPDPAIAGRDLSKRPVSETGSTIELLTSGAQVGRRCSSNSLASTVTHAESTISREDTARGDSYTLPIELATQRTQTSESSWTTADRTTRRRSADSLRLEASEQDIELDHIKAGAFAGKSSKKPARLPGEQKAGTISTWTTSSSSGSDTGTKFEHPILPGPLPDYKPNTLRWPFQVLLVLIIAGTFAFFEYQIHNLPPVRYKMFHVNPPVQNRVEDSTSPYLKPSPVTRISNGTPATTYSTPTMSPEEGLGRGIRIAAPIPEPAPTPRPDESAYPGPIGRTSTYCGWAPPVWVLYTKVTYTSYSNGQGVGEPMTGLNIEQTYPTFWTEDDTWCPCLVEIDTDVTHKWWTVPQWKDWPWSSGWATRIPGPDFYVSTHDKECRSVLSALNYFNTERWTTFVPPDDLLVSVNVQELSTELTVTEHPVSQLPWPWPVTDGTGQVSMPFLVGKRDDVGTDFPEGIPVEDEFGNTDSSDFFVNAWTTATEGFSLMWWSLPFAQSSMMSSSAEVLPITTSDANIPSSSTLVSSEQGTTTTEKVVETSSQSPSKPEQSPVESTSTGTEGKTAFTSTNDGTDTVTSRKSETGEETTVAVATSTSSGSDSSRPGGIGAGTSTERITGKEQTTTPVSDSTRDSAPSSPALSEGQIQSTTTTGNSEPIRPSSGLSSSSPSPDGTTPILNSSPTTTNSQGDNSVGISGDQNPTSVIVHHSTSYTIHVNPGPKIFFSSSSSDGGISSSLANGTAFPVPSPTGINDQEPFEPSPTPYGPIPPGTAARFTNLHSEADFLMASLFPVLLATAVATAVQVFTSRVSSMLPFRGLGHGAQLKNSLMLPRNTGILTIWSVSIRFLRRYHDPLPLLNGLLILLSILLVPVSSEAIKLEISTTCHPRKGRPPSALVESPLVVCAFGLRKSGVTMRLSEGILITIVVLMIAVGYILLRWRTGVATEPWSIASMAALMSDKELREMLRSIPNGASNGAARLRDKDVRDTIGEGRRFRIGYHQRLTGSSRSRTELAYGIYEIAASECDSSVRLTTRDPSKREATVPGRPAIGRWHTVKRSTKDSVIRGTAVALTTGLLILILHYELTIGPDTKFEEFMNSQSFGVRVLFTTFGTVIGWFWDEYFSRMSSHTIYQRLATDDKPQPARTSILLSTQPADPFTAIYRAATPVLDIPLLTIAVARLFAKLTPILFSGIPFRNTITFRMHEACTWTAVGILLIMVCVLLHGLLGPLLCSGKRGIRGIDMPVGVDTIVGCMYYLAGSKMVKDFEGLSMMSTRERDRLVCEMRRRYAFRRAPSNSDTNNRDQRTDLTEGSGRMRVDYVEAFGEGTSNRVAR
ncbi:hypothetical protein V8F20_001813 [Naviculisporaceae sp. PSN 640]